MSFDNDGFDFGFFRANQMEDDDRAWRDIPMFGVPDVNRDGRHDINDLLDLVTAALAAAHARESQAQVAAVVESSFDRETNTVTVTATDSDGHQAVGTYDFDSQTRGGDTTIA
jgi:hypothetical protein